MATKRLLALDVLRGLTIALMILVNTPGSWSHVYAPLLHAPWNGCTPTDLVFPFFLFIVGASMWYSFKKYGKGLSSTGLKKVFKRFVLIYLIGLFLNAFPNFDFENLRVYGVLERIAIAYALAAILCMKFDLKQLIYASIILLLGYWAIIHFGGTYDLEGNIVRKVDLWLVGENHIYGGYGIPFDPEGLVSSIPAVVTVLLGYFTGSIVERSGSVLNGIKKLIFIGIGLVILGKIWDLGFPINKPIWSSSYVVYTGGLAMLFLALLLWLIDVKEVKKIFIPFIHFGTNPLFIYVLSGMIGGILGFMKVTNEAGDTVRLLRYYYTDILVPILGDLNGSLAYAISHVVFLWLVAYILYKRKIFIKI
ncbi:acyltransferase family protein [Urechidicola vernalis]|uniref:Heparan-alpha-glucosaminide N-acetyltransferase domain-containing protein n=1 Tax=Urechidicola vernalis TaxID=3075600 RepID=A0ABU2Y606_9FLAO|nr:heparan-alpha-glucosaminide N-acetyltransferase domain-containing protein [Urechidicola sp. P050]MDT0553200.1 heparan-alpha-glucosaminide N-acetyltransferase domain-containing protein [Urechidicola sp. P050]